MFGYTWPAFSSILRVHVYYNCTEYDVSNCDLGMSAAREKSGYISGKRPAILQCLNSGHPGAD